MKSLSQAAMSIQVLVSSFSKAQGKEIQPRSSTWKRASEGFVSVNVDAKYDINMRSGATGVVIRDDKGRFVGAGSKLIPFALDGATAEAQAVLDGIHLANQIGCQKLVIQSDCAGVIDTLLEGGFSATVAAPIFEDIRIQASSFDKILFMHCPRKANRVAHTLAHECRLDSCVWADDPPSFILPLLIDDVSMI